MKPVRIATLISGGGRTLLNIADHIDRGELPAEIAVVIASRDDCVGVERARARGFDVRVASRRDFPSEDAMHDAIAAWLDETRVDLVCTCGYLRRLRIDESWRGRIINIHPSLLPDFGGHGMYGDRVHAAVLAAGHLVSGCTVHFVDEDYDHGPVIVQRQVPVRPDDTPETLAARVFEQECVAYPEAIRLYAEGRVRLANGRVARS